MIQHLKGTATFKNSGATITVDFQPAIGITAVVGPNGAGKTFVASEFARWLLFGTKALRSTLSSYSRLEGVGMFTIRGETYLISREPKDTSIVQADGIALAVGTDEVNKKVVELLGYPLEVFDLCNSVVQGKVSELGDLVPAKRKAMIDDVLRLTDIKTIEKALRDEATGLRREAEALERTRKVIPDAPLKPIGYVQSDVLNQQIKEAAATVKQIQTLTGKLKDVEEPTKPTSIMPASIDVAMVQRHEDDRRALELHRERLEKQLVDPMPRSLEAIDNAVTRFYWEQERDRRGPRPILTQAEVDEIRHNWDLIESTVDHPAVCPNCAHEFRTSWAKPKQPEWSRLDLAIQQRALSAWADPLPPEPTAQDGAYGEAQAMAMRTAWEACKALQALKALEDRSHQLARLRAAQEEWQRYIPALDAYESQQEINEAINEEIDQLGPEPDLEGLYRQMMKAQTYEQDLQRYELAVEDERTLGLTIAMKLKLAEQFKEGSTELADARAELKSYLSPALSREASELIFDMTNGKLKTIVVDDDMEISVDGQLLETLSGAGKTVANLALRLAFSKVLVADAFPVFIADEIDGDLDIERRGATIEAIRSLKKHFKQIILITHRDVSVADYVKELT
jgi:exonuclease SbcC